MRRSDDDVFLLVKSGNVVGSGRLVDEREVEGGLLREVEDVVAVDDWIRRQGLLVVVHGGWKQAQLMHRSTQVVETLLKKQTQFK